MPDFWQRWSLRIVSHYGNIQYDISGVCHQFWGELVKTTVPGEPHLGTLKGPWRDPNGVPEVPTNNDIAVRNLLGSTTALHLDHSTCFTTVPDEDVFFPVDYTWDTKKVCKVHCSSDKLEKPALRCQHPQTSDGTLLAVSWSMGCFGMSWVSFFEISWILEISPTCVQEWFVSRVYIMKAQWVCDQQEQPSNECTL
jgi:hypothetical protein